MNPFESAVKEGLGSWPPGTVFLAAVSGGADSTAMLAALAVLAPHLGFVLHCLHVEHGIRPPGESQGDAEAVSALCGSLSVPCRIVRLAPGRVHAAAGRGGLGIEGAARLFRHAAWTREARRIGALRVLTAHTREDLLETVCMRFLRGSGPEGLAAMPRDRVPGPQGGPGILRPLLSLGRSDVLRYLEERGIPYRTDSTNDDPAFLRNRIRKSLFPLLDAQFPGWRRAVLALGETQRLTADFIRAEAEARLPWQPAGETGGGEAWFLPEDAFFAQPGIVREEALFLGTDRFRGIRGESPDRRDPVPGPPRRRAVRLFCRTPDPAGSPAGKALDLGACRVERRQGFIILSSKRPSWEEGFSLLIKEPGRYKLKGIVIECTSSPQPGKASFSAALPLVLRRYFKDDSIRRRAYKEPGAGGQKFPRGLLGFPSGFQYTCISALDAEGAAAFIGRRGSAGFGIIASRDEDPNPGKFFFSINNQESAGAVR
jgi:tRNA(Ile)-lysidine synthase